MLDNYRNLSFFDFIKRDNCQQLKKSLILFFVLSFIDAVFNFALFSKVSFLDFVITILSFSIFLIILNLVIYRKFKKGNELFDKKISKNEFVFYKKVKSNTIEIIPTNRKTSSRAVLAKYSFEYIDLFLLENSFFILGEKEIFFMKIYESPIEIIVSENSSKDSVRKLINWKKESSRIIVEIDDKFFKESIKIEFKSHIKEIHDFYLTNYPNFKVNLDIK